MKKRSPNNTRPESAVYRQALKLVEIKARAKAADHVASRKCWCSPTVEYTDPETGVSVLVHHQAQ